VLPAGPASEPGSAVLADALMLQPLAVQLAIGTGDLALAASWLDASRRWLEWSGAVSGQVEHHLAVACLSLAKEDTGVAMEHAARAVELSMHPFQPLARIDALRIRGSLTGMHGDIDGAVADLEEALVLADGCPAPFERARLLVQLAEVTGDVSKIAEATGIAAHLHAAPLLQRIDTLMAGGPPRPGFDLTARELEVLRHAAQGLTDAEIGERLFISHRTVSQHLRSVYGKLNVRSRAAATRLVVEHHLG
jgi:DNA-binding CsgD family transcriptional regulator